MSEAPNGHSFVSLALLAFASVGGFVMGYDTSVISGVKQLPVSTSFSCTGDLLTLYIKAWLERFGSPVGDGTYAITTSQESLVVSILSAGTFFGALSSVCCSLSQLMTCIDTCLI